MDQQHLCINAATGEVRATNVSSSLPSLTGILGTLFVLRVTFERDNVPIALASGTTGKLVMKLDGQESGALLLEDTAWTAAGSGAAASYTFSLLADSDPLRAALEGKKAIALTAQIEWDLTAEEQPRKSLAFPVVIANSPSRPTDAAPALTDAAWAWIKARLVEGSNIEFDIDDTAKTITINAAGAEAVTSVAWADVTSKPSIFPSNWDSLSGKPSTYPPSTHNHSWAQINSGSPSDNAALVSFVQSNAGTGESFDLLIPLEGGDTDSFDSITLGLPVATFPRAAVITHASLGVSGAVPRSPDLLFQVLCNLYLTQPAAATGTPFAASYWFYETLPNDTPRGVGIPLLVAGSLTIPAGTELDIVFDTGSPLDGYSSVPTFAKVWLRVRGRYTN
jgi:hypothetical protein